MRKSQKEKNSTREEAKQNVFPRTIMAALAIAFGVWAIIYYAFAQEDVGTNRWYAAVVILSLIGIFSVFQLREIFIDEEEKRMKEIHDMFLVLCTLECNQERKVVLKEKARFVSEIEKRGNFLAKLDGEDPEKIIIYFKFNDENEKIQYDVVQREKFKEFYDFAE